MSGEQIKITTKLEGAEDLLKEFAALGGNVRSTARTALRAGGKVIQAQAESNAGGLIKKAAKCTQLKISARPGGIIQVRIGPSNKKWYLRYAETGVTPHEITGAPLVFEGDAGLVIIGGVHHPGMAARPWLRPAFDSKQAEAPAAVGDVLRRAVEERRAIVESGADEDE